MDVARALDQANAVCDLVEASPALNAPRDREMHMRYAMSALARSRSLLGGMVALVENGRTDVLGVLLRAIYEQWLVGMLAVKGDQADIERLNADHAYWQHDLATKLPAVVAGQTAPNGKLFSVWKRAQRVAVLHGADSLDWYALVFSVESYNSVHAGAGSLERYASVQDDGSIAIVLNPTEPPSVVFGRVKAGAVIVALLAKELWIAGGADGRPFDEIPGLADV